MLALPHWLHVFRWPLVPCTVLVWDCICVCARTGPRLPDPRALNPLTVPCVCVLLWTLLVLRSVYARSCGVSPRSPLPFWFFFSCVYRCEHDKMKTFRWRPHPSFLHPTHQVLFPPLLMLSSKNRKKTGWWNLWCPHDSSIRSINTPVGRVFRWLWWRN